MFGQVKETSSVRPAGSVSYSATAYCLTGKMSNGKRVHQGAVAADTRLLPIGSKLYIHNFGTYVVSDTGGDIKGRRLDIWFSSCNQAIRFGRKQVNVSIV